MILTPSQIAAANVGLSKPGRTPKEIADAHPDAQPGQIGSLEPTTTTSTIPSEPPTSSVAETSAETSAVTPPSSDLQKGAKGQDVVQLQNFLSSTINPQTGAPYLTQQQIATGSGIYGPQTMSAVSELQKTLDVKGGAGTGQYGPQTKAALARKYNSLFGSLKNTKAPDKAGIAAEQIAIQTKPSTDPVFESMFSALDPIMNSLTQILKNINNPALTTISLQQEYNDLATKNNLPSMQADMLNMQRIMTGTENDIRDEISKSGGTATESQILGMSAARNKVILKQYNAVATQYQAAQTNIQNMMQYATTDQATQLQRQTATAGIVENMASIETQMMTMGITMQNHATDNLNKIVTNIGYTGLASQAGDDPQKLSQYEQILGLSKGALSNPTALKQMETYRQQQLQMSQQKIVLQYGSPIPAPGQPSSTPTPGMDTTGLIPSPASSPTGANGGDILSATGLSVQAFNFLTQGTQTMSRFTPAQRNKIMAETTDWLKKNSVDMSTFQSQYVANNTTLSNNIQRFNNTQIAEGEVLGTLSNMDSTSVAAGLGNVNLVNVAKVLVGQNVNDSSANEYAFYFNDLKNSLSYYYAAQQGKASPDVVDNKDAANVIVGGLAKGGVKGLQTAVQNTTAKMKIVLSGAVDNARQNVWNLFGVGSKYQSPDRPIKVKSPDGKSTGMIPASQLKDALAKGYSQI